MSWLEKLLPPKIQHTDPSDRRSVPEGVWVKCPSCETVLYKSDLQANQNVCPTCSHHHRMSARERARFNIDPLPGDLHEASVALRKDKIVQESLGPVIYRYLMEAQQALWKDYSAHVHPWEIEHYLAFY